MIRDREVGVDGALALHLTHYVKRLERIAGVDRRTAGLNDALLLTLWEFEELGRDCAGARVAGDAQASGISGIPQLTPRETVALVKTKDAVRILNTGERNVRRLADAGFLTKRRAGRCLIFDEAEVLALAEARSIAA